MYENIKYEVKGDLGFITINRPKAMNALNTDVLAELAEALKEIESDDAVKAVIVTGEGKAFVAGADIAQMSKLNAVEGRAMMQAGHKVMNTIDQMPKPFIAAVNGRIIIILEIPIFGTACGVDSFRVNHLQKIIPHFRFAFISYKQNDHFDSSHDLLTHL